MNQYKFIINTKYFPYDLDSFEKNFDRWMDDHMSGDTERYGCYARSAQWRLIKQHGYYWFETNDSYLYKNLYENYRIFPNNYQKFEQQILEIAQMKEAAE